jgi:hypothetical protein
MASEPQVVAETHALDRDTVCGYKVDELTIEKFRALCPARCDKGLLTKLKAQNLSGVDLSKKVFQNFGGRRAVVLPTLDKPVYQYPLNQYHIDGAIEGNKAQFLATGYSPASKPACLGCPSALKTRRSTTRPPPIPLFRDYNVY